jgi:hypothetical protein
MRLVEAFQQLDVFFAKAVASMMLLSVLNSSSLCTLPNWRAAVPRSR